MQENIDNISKVVRGIISASVEFAGGNISDEMIDAIISGYTAKDTIAFKDDKVPVAKRYYHTLKHPLDIMMRIEPSLTNMIEQSIADGSSARDVKEEYIKYISTLPEIKAKRLIALGISAPFHDLVYHVDGEIHPKVYEQFLANVLNEDLSWKAAADLHAPISRALSADDKIKLESMGSERLSMIAAEMFMHRCQIHDPEILLQACTDIEATIAFRDNKYQGEFSRRYKKFCKENDFEQEKASEILENALNFPNNADLGAFNRAMTPELSVATETAVHTEMDKRITLGQNATPVDAANAFCRDFYFFNKLVLPGLDNHSRWAFRVVALSKGWPEIAEDIEKDEAAKINVKERALLAGARSAAAGLLIAAGFGESAISDSDCFMDRTLPRFEQMSNESKDSIASSVSKSLKGYTKSSPAINMGNLDKLASILLDKCPIPVIDGLASVISDIVVEQGTNQALSEDSIKRNLIQNAPHLINQKLAHFHLDGLSQIIGATLAVKS